MIETMPDYADLTLKLGLEMSAGEGVDVTLQKELAARTSSVETEHATFAEWCRRADALYYTTTFAAWGADLWADDPSATTPGRSHVSVNTPAVYVDVPAALQAVPPVENMLATADSPEARDAANALERVRSSWKTKERYDLKRAKATTVKGLYGKTAGFVYYDREKKRPCVDVIQNPRNLYLGYKNDDYEDIEWAAHVSLQDPSAVTEKYSVEFTARMVPGIEGKIVPWVVGVEMADRPRPEMNWGPARVEVWDYWYRKPGKRGNRGEPTKMETWNVVIAGNGVVRGPFLYDEYDGEIPYKPLFNTFIPGTPTGRADLHDMENLIREKMTRITAGAQVIRDSSAGQFWQLVGADAPSRVPPGAKPRLNEVATPGAGNRIEAITPFIAQFQLEQFLTRIDREMAVVSGVNDLLLGLVPAQALSSSKAVNALLANFETRISMRRLLLYVWEKDIWELVVRVWVKKDENVARIVKAGGGTLDIIDPSLSPRDEMETATRAANLVNAKLWSQARGMDAVGVDDPEQEQSIIREERTDATLFPADVQVMAQLLAALQSLGLQVPPNATGQAEAQLGSGQNDLRNALGAGTPDNTTSSQLPGDQGITPPIPGAGPEAGGAPTPFVQPPAGPAQSPALAQTMIQNGTAKSRILTQQKLGRR